MSSAFSALAFGVFGEYLVAEVFVSAIVVWVFAVLFCSLFSVFNSTFLAFAALVVDFSAAGGGAYSPHALTLR